MGNWRCPFPTGADADEWQRGFEAEKKSWAAPADGKNEKRLRELEAQR